MIQEPYPYQNQTTLSSKISGLLSYVEFSPWQIVRFIPPGGHSWRIPEIEEIEALKDEIFKILPRTPRFKGK